MTRQQARRLVAQLNAAYPTPGLSEATFAVYAAALERLDDAEAAQEVIAALVDELDWLPPVARIRREYAAAVRRRRELTSARGLPEPRWTPIPAETLEWLRQHGINVDGLIARMDDYAA